MNASFNIQIKKITRGQEQEVKFIFMYEPKQSQLRKLVSKLILSIQCIYCLLMKSSSFLPTVTFLWHSLLWIQQWRPEICLSLGCQPAQSGPALLISTAMKFWIWRERGRRQNPSLSLPLAFLIDNPIPWKCPLLQEESSMFKFNVDLISKPDLIVKMTAFGKSNQAWHSVTEHCRPAYYHLPWSALKLFPSVAPSRHRKFFLRNCISTISSLPRLATHELCSLLGPR